MKKFFKILFFGVIPGMLLMLIAVFTYVWFTLPDVAHLAKENPKTTSMMEYRREAAAADGKKLTIRQEWRSLSQMPEMLRNAIVLSEDASFWSHEGVDWDEMKKMLRERWEEGKDLRGASTITQQTAKNLYLTPERSFFRKFREYFIARRLEESLSKSRILEIYFNIIEFGNGNYGVESASNYYFSKSVSALTTDEIVRLIAVIPNPHRMRPDRPSRELRWRTRVLLTRLNVAGRISDAEYQAARSVLTDFFEGSF